MISLYRKYRPKELKALIGQDGAIASLQKLVDGGTIPHALLLSGPSGCGKTTVARILRSLLKCGPADYLEVDCPSVDSPLETVKQIQRASKLSPMDGPVRIFFLEEAQSLSRAGFSQQALLKLLEDVPEHAYFFLATTDAGKLHKAIHTRCTEVVLSAISRKDLELLIQRVLNKEGGKLSEDVVTEIAEVADGSARKALVVLEQVMKLETEEEQLKAIKASSFNKDEAIDLARALFSWKGSTWQEVAKILRNLGDQDVEGIRYCVLGYARSCLVGKEDKPPNMKFADKAYRIIDIFSKDFYTSKHAGLAAACWEVLMK